METERPLAKTRLPRGVRLWLLSVGIITLQQLAKLSHERLIQFSGFQGVYLRVILVVGIDEGMPMMGLSLEEMAETVVHMVGDSVTARQLSEREKGRPIPFDHQSSLTA